MCLKTGGADTTTAGQRDERLSEAVLDRFAREWRRHTRKLQNDMVLLRQDMGESTRLKAEIEHLREQVRVLQRAKEEEVGGLVTQTDTLYANISL